VIPIVFKRQKDELLTVIQQQLDEINVICIYIDVMGKLKKRRIGLRQTRVPTIL
jgi:hypothetical protein